MGARPMARVIQEHIKKAADEVLFGRLKTGGHVRVVVVTDEAGNSKLGFEYPDGPVKPPQEKLPESRRAKAKRRSTPRRKPSGPRRNASLSSWMDSLRIRPESIPVNGTLVVARISYEKPLALEEALRFKGKPHDPIDHVQMAYEEDEESFVVFPLARSA
jgi:hypothetical protein